MILPHDRQIAAWLDEGPDQGPSEPLARALAATRRTSKRPRWSFPERWLPMQLTFQRPLVPRAVVYLTLLALLIAAVGVAALLVPGSQPVPAPLGVANGSIAYDSGGKIYLADANGSNGRLLGQPGNSAYSPAFSPDGTQLAYLSTNDVGQLHVFVANADGTNAHQVSQVAFDRGRNKFPPVWSPDGRQLVHYAIDGGVWVMAADGSSQKRIAEGWSVAWSPDGEWIAFRADGSPDALLRVIHPDGSGLHSLTTAEANTDSFASISWTADSSRIVFHRGGDGILTVDLDQNEELLSPEGAYPTLSPDGRFVAFMVENDGGEVVKLVELATREISTLGPGGCGALWAPDSTAIVTFANGCFNDLAVVPIEDPSAAVTIELPYRVDGFPGWQAIPASAAPADQE
jgi:dipeptidyl aminopeptidase/acylaminoacyl peptidase